MNAEYRHTLEVLPTWQRRGWLDGDWDIEAGQFFTTWQDSAHVIDHFDPARVKYWCAAMDYGYTHPTVFLLGARDTDNNLFVLDEHAQREA